MQTTLLQRCCSILLPAIAMTVFLTLLPSASAYLYNLSYECHNGCLGNTSVTWNLTVHKGAASAFELSHLSIINSKTLEVLAMRNISLTVYDRENVLIKGRLPRFRGETAFNVSACFTALLPAKDRFVDEIFLGTHTTFCEKRNHTMPLYGCISSASCAADEACRGNICTALRCGSCQYIAGNQCINYQCCADSQCGGDEQCLANFCAKLDCPDTEAAGNHTCLPLNCGEAEKAENHRCLKLSCAGNEYAVQHACLQLDCAEGEYAANHTCSPLNCEGDKKAVNHTCIAVQRTEAELPPLPSSPNNFFVSPYQLTEVAILSLIAALLVLDLQLGLLRKAALAPVTRIQTFIKMRRRDRKRQ